MITGLSLDGLPLPRLEADRARLMALVATVNEAPQSDAARVAVRVIAVYMLLVTGGITAQALAPMMHPGAALHYAERRVLRVWEREEGAA